MIRALFQRHWETLRDHTRAVVEQMDARIAAGGPDTANSTSARHPHHPPAEVHDAGEAHTVFQEMLTRGAPPGKSRTTSGEIRCEPRPPSTQILPSRTCVGAGMAAARSEMARAFRPNSVHYCRASRQGPLIHSFAAERRPRQPEPGRLFAPRNLGRRSAAWWRVRDTSS